jgi:hypothetical protein
MTDKPQPDEPATHQTSVGSPDISSPTPRKRKQADTFPAAETSNVSTSGYGDPGGTTETTGATEPGETGVAPAKKSRTNTPWTPAEERRLKSMRDAGNSWNEIAKVGA